MQKGLCTRLAAGVIVAACLGSVQAVATEGTQPAAGGWTVREIEVQAKPSYKFRGRMFLDQVWMDDLRGPGGVRYPEDNFTGFDTLRLGVEGNVDENLKYLAEFDFRGQAALFRDCYAEYENLPWLGAVMVGHFREPFSLEEQVSSRFDTFMKRSAPKVAFSPTRNFGAMFFDALGDRDDFSWFAGLFRGGFHHDWPARGDDDVAGSGDSNDWAATGRLVWLPYYDEATPGRCLLHTGVGCSLRRVGIDVNEPGNGQMRGFLELDARTGPISTYLPANTEYTLIGTELAWMRGPLNVVNEFYFVDANSGAAPWGAYIEASYFLTGENRGYKKSLKAFDRVQVYEPVFALRTTSGVVRGWGAWQLAARWDYLDLSGPGFAPGTVLGRQANFTFGVNWYLNSYNRVMLNFVHTNSDVTDPGGVPGIVPGSYTGNHVGVRYQIDW